MVSELIPDVTFSSLERKAYKRVFIENFPKKTRSIHNDFSYQKYISGSMATQEKNTYNIQICTKLYVSCNYIHKDFSLSRQRKHQHSVRAAPGMRVLDRTAVQYMYSPKTRKSKVCLIVGSPAPSWGVFMRCDVKTKTKTICVGLFTRLHAALKK